MLDRKMFAIFRGGKLLLELAIGFASVIDETGSPVQGDMIR